MYHNQRSDLPTSVIDVLMEFIEVAIHNILYIRKLYPEVIYSDFQKYGCRIYKSMHPDLNEYIESCMTAIQHFAKKGKLSKVVLCFRRNYEVIEKVVFDMLSLKAAIDQDHYLMVTESLFRSFFLKLVYRSNHLKPLEDDTNFTIQIHTSQSDAIDYMNNPEYQKFPWINTDDDKTKDSNIIPLLDLEEKNLHVQVYMIAQTNE